MHTYIRDIYRRVYVRTNVHRRTDWQTCMRLYIQAYIHVQKVRDIKRQATVEGYTDILRDRHTRTKANRQTYSHAHYLIEFISGSGAIPVNWNVIVFSPRFTIFKNVVHSLEPGETPSNSALGVSPGSKLCTTFLKIAKHYETAACVFG